MKKKRMLSNADMLMHGCKNCVLLAVEKCPHNIKANEEYSFIEDNKEIKGFCPEYFNFIISFAEENDTPSMMWEKVFLALPKEQGMKDYLECAQLKKEIDELRIMNPQSSLLAEKERRYEMLKLWTTQLSLNIAKAQARISDREARKQEQGEAKKITIQQFNLMMKESTKLLEDKE
jgi:hypothetical protein